MHKSNNENQLVQDISYSYELVSDNGKLNCIGTLNFSLNLPFNNISYLFFERTIQRSKIDIPGMVIFFNKIDLSNQYHKHIKTRYLLGYIF